MKIARFYLWDFKVLLSKHFSGFKQQLDIQNYVFILQYIRIPDLWVLLPLSM